MTTPNQVNIQVTATNRVRPGFAAAQASAADAGNAIERIWAKHADAINGKLSNLGSGLGKGAGLLSIGSAALAMAGPLGAAAAAIGAFGVVAVPELSKVQGAMSKTGKAGQQAWAQLTPDQQRLGSAIKGVEASFHNVQKALAPVVDQVVTLGARTLKDAMPALAQLASAGGRVISAFLKPLDSFIRSKVFSQIIDQFSKFAVQAGNLVGPALTRLLQLLLQLFVQLMPSGVAILKILLPLILQLVTDLTPVIVVTAKVVAVILNWLTQTKLLKPVLLGLVPVLILLSSASGIGLVITAVALLITGIVELSRNWRKIWSDIKQWAKDAWDFLTHGWGQVLIPGLFIIRKEVEFVRDHWRAAWNAIRGVGETFLGWYRGSLIARIVSGVTEIVRWFSNLRGNASSIISRLRSELAGLWDSIWRNTVSRVANGVRDVTNWVRELPGRIVNAIGNAGRMLYDKGRSIIQGLLSGMASIIGSVWNFIKGIPGKILGFLGIHSPPEWAIDAGKHIMNGLGIGMGQARGALGRATNAFRSAVTGAGEGVTRWIPLIQRVLQMEHLDPSLLRNVLRQMQTESGGNPRAINLSDINAQHGDPSRGLLQTIGSTFAAYHWPGTSGDIYDPMANIAAAINYARHRYGPSLMSGGMGMGSGHGYASGGITSGGYAWVGEHGRELMKLPPGAQIYSNADSAGGGGVQTVVLRIEGGASDFDQYMIAWIKRHARILGGGSVEAAFGRK